MFTLSAVYVNQSLKDCTRSTSYMRASFASFVYCQEKLAA